MRIFRALAACAVLMLTPATAALAAPGPSKTFTSAQDGFAVDVPGTPDLKVLEGGIRAFVYVAPPYAYMITTTPIPGGESYSSAVICEKVYEGMKGTGTEPGPTRAATLGGMPALEADLVAGGAPGVARCAFDGKRAYLVAFLNAPSVERTEATRLFNSFRVIR